MVMQSVKPGAAFFDEKVPWFNNQPSHETHSCEPANPNEHPFYNLAASLPNNNNNNTSIQCYSVGCNSCTPAVERAFVLSASAYVDAVRPVTALNKESLTRVLEFADECGCGSVFACVKKSNALFQEIVRSFSDAGFSAISPLNNDMVKLRFVI